ncbi:MAG: mechanosensitive ion channel [Candidatus Nealsonbacteria bacterium]|nr:mechanosensitive ion channel [Candidatus Nealsonbacteria bacterium]
MIDSFFPWLSESWFKIAVILFVAVLINRYAKRLLRQTIDKLVQNKIEGDNKRRVDTLVGVLGGTIRFVVWIIAFMLILPEFGVDPAPILAGVGLLGLAVGLASKDIIADFISGLFILLEDHYHIGDIVKVAGVEGKVELITLRRTILKDENGVVHSVPNSQIKIVSKNLK